MQMTRKTKVVSIGACAVAAALIATSASALEDSILAVAYGNGVHAYYAGDYQRSYEELSTAIDGGTQDPRAFYFRGLAALRLGRLDEANADFALGADAEAAGRGGWAVGRSLERIQGEPRLQLERHRVRARMVAMQRRVPIIRHYPEAETINADVRRSIRPETLPDTPTPVAEAQAEEEEEKEPAKETVAAPAASKEEEDEKDEAAAEKPAAPEPKPAPKPAPPEAPYVDPFDDPF